jgi:hypothetical protein
MTTGTVQIVTLILVLAAAPVGAWGMDADGDANSAFTEQSSADEGDSKGPATERGTRAFGVKAAYHGVLSSGQTYASLASIGFDARLEFGHRLGFFELGASLFVRDLPPLGADTAEGDVLGYWGFGTELGASFYLLRGVVAPYLGIGLLPRALMYTGLYGDTYKALRVGGYGQAGVMFESSSGVHVYLDIRVGQFFSCFPKMHRQGGPTPETNEWVGSGGEVCPTEVGAQTGVSF